MTVDHALCCLYLCPKLLQSDSLSRKCILRYFGKSISSKWKKSFGPIMVAKHMDLALVLPFLSGEYILLISWKAYSFLSKCFITSTTNRFITPIAPACTALIQRPRVVNWQRTERNCLTFYSSDPIAFQINCPVMHSWNQQNSRKLSIESLLRASQHNSQLSPEAMNQFIHHNWTAVLALLRSVYFSGMRARKPLQRRDSQLPQVLWVYLPWPLHWPHV